MQSNFNLGYAIFFLLQVLNQVFYIADAFSPLLNKYLNTNISLIIFEPGIYVYNMAFQLAFMFLLFELSFLFIMAPFEKYMRESKKYPVSVVLLAAIGVLAVFLIFGNIFPGEAIHDQVLVAAFLGIFHPIGTLVVLVGFIISIVAALYFYIKLAVQSPGEIRRKSLAIAFGLLTLMLSVLIGNAFSSQLKSIHPAGALVGPIFFYAGTILLAYGFKRKL